MRSQLYNDIVVDRGVSSNETSRFLQEVILGVCVCIKLDCEWGKIKRENYFGEIQKGSLAVSTVVVAHQGEKFGLPDDRRYKVRLLACAANYY